MRSWIVGMAALALAGCEAPRDMVPVAEQAVTQFHQQLDAGQVAAIKAAAEPGQPITSDRAGAMLDALRIRLGKVVSSKRTSLKDGYQGAARMITMTYDTAFADGIATEEFAYHITGGKAVLSSYSVVASDNVVTDFHKRLDAGDYAAVDAMAGPEIANSGQKLSSILKQVHDKMGAVKSTKCAKFDARVANGVRTIEVTYDTLFESGAESEEFVFRIKPDGSVEIAGYHVKPAGK